jgi:hypothetical protein
VNASAPATKEIKPRRLVCITREHRLPETLFQFEAAPEASGYRANRPSPQRHPKTMTSQGTVAAIVAIPTLVLIALIGWVLRAAADWRESG